MKTPSVYITEAPPAPRIEQRRVLITNAEIMIGNEHFPLINVDRVRTAHYHWQRVHEVWVDAGRTQHRVLVTRDRWFAHQLAKTIQRSVAISSISNCDF